MRIVPPCIAVIRLSVLFCSIFILRIREADLSNETCCLVRHDRRACTSSHARVRYPPLIQLTQHSLNPSTFGWRTLHVSALLPFIQFQWTMLRYSLRRNASFPGRSSLHA
jgi:hypothetical protein